MTEEQGETTGRGRPRPNETIERDEKVRAFLGESGPNTRKGIVEGTGLAGNEVYLSLYRLRVANVAKREGSTWSLVEATAAA